MFRVWRTKVLSGVFVLVVLVLVYGADRAVPSERENGESPLYQARLEATISEWEDGGSGAGREGAAGEGTNMPLGVSIFVPPPSACFASICALSVCLPSYCLGSLCWESRCLGSVCLDSFCAYSGCAGSRCHRGKPIVGPGATLNPNDCNQS